jgi:hypothetical protein
MMAGPNFGADLLLIHKVMTRGIHVASEHADTYQEEGYPDLETQTGYERYVQALTELLHVHHDGEDHLAWPFLRDRLPDEPYAKLVRQHNEITTILERIETAIDTGDLAGLSEELSKLDTHWHEHIDIEESAFSIGKTEEALTDKEQIAISSKLSQHTIQHAEPTSLILPFTLYNLEPQDREVLIKKVPPDQREQILAAAEGPWKEHWSPMEPFLLV